MLFSEEKIIKELYNLLYAKSFKELLAREIFDDVKEDDKKEVANHFAKSVSNIGIKKRIDNLRIYKESNLKTYKNLRISGNREFFDTTITTSLGNTYLIGFNHD